MAPAARSRPASALSENADPFGTDDWDDWAAAEASIDADTAGGTTAEPAAQREDESDDGATGDFWATAYKIGFDRQREAEKEKARKPGFMDHLAPDTRHLDDLFGDAEPGPLARAPPKSCARQP